MDGTAFIHADPGILHGRPVVRGTRLSVELLLDLLAEGWTHDQLLMSYPQLTPHALRAIFAFAAETMREQRQSHQS